VPFGCRIYLRQAGLTVGEFLELFEDKTYFKEKRIIIYE
jgi:hypothetical protein